MAPRDANDSGPDDHRDLDAPTPPGGPLRQDAPDAEVNPIDTVGQPGEEPERQSVQEENAETSLDQPSDGSGGE